MKIMDVQTLHDKMQQGDKVFLLDVREENEWNLCHIPGNVWIPMGQIPERLQEIPADAEIVVYCHHGGRSQRVATFLQQKGYENIANLQGGIDDWAVLVDPTVPRY